MARLHFPSNASSIIIKTRIEGKRGVADSLMVLDTGASFVMLPWKLATAIGLSIDPKQTIRTTTASTIETSPFAIIPSVGVLGYSVKNVGCIIRDLPGESHVDGLLGLSFLRRFNIMLQFQKGILEMFPWKS